MNPMYVSTFGDLFSIQNRDPFWKNNQLLWWRDEVFFLYEWNLFIHMSQQYTFLNSIYLINDSEIVRSVGEIYFAFASLANSNIKIELFHLKKGFPEPEPSLEAIAEKCFFLILL